MIRDAVSSLSERIAGRVRGLRAGKGLSLEALASRSGVSRSMISLIERGETSPTAVVLEKLATSLGVSLASLFDPPAHEIEAAPGPLSRRDQQVQWRDPDSGYVRRNVTPPGSPQPMRIVEVEFPPGGRVAFENQGHEMRIDQQVWVLDGTIDVRLGDESYRLSEGDCLAMRLDRPSMFYNPTSTLARYAVVIASEPSTR